MRWPVAIDGKFRIWFLCCFSLIKLWLTLVFGFFAHPVFKNPKSNIMRYLFSELQDFLSPGVCWPGVASSDDAATWEVLLYHRDCWKCFELCALVNCVLKRQSKSWLKDLQNAPLFSFVI